MKREMIKSTYTHNGVEKEINIFTSISASDKVRFITSASNILVGDNYYPIVKDLIFNFEIINFFTDFDVSEIKNAEDTFEAIENLFEETDIVEKAKENIDEDIIEELRVALEKNIEYRTGIHTDVLANGISRFLDVFTNTFAQIDTDKIIKMITGIGDSSKEFTTDRLIDAYSKSNLFKEKIKQSKKDKED